MTNSNSFTEQELAELEEQAHIGFPTGPAATLRLAAALREARAHLATEHARNDILNESNLRCLDTTRLLTAERDALRAAIRTALAAYHTDPNAFVKAMDELAKLVEKS